MIIPSFNIVSNAINVFRQKEQRCASQDFRALFALVKNLLESSFERKNGNFKSIRKQISPYFFLMLDAPFKQQMHVLVFRLPFFRRSKCIAPDNKRADAIFQYSASRDGEFGTMLSRKTAFKCVHVHHFI